MPVSKQNIVLALIAAIILIIVIYFLNKDNNKNKYSSKTLEKFNQQKAPSPSLSNNQLSDDISLLYDDIIEDNINEESDSVNDFIYKKKKYTMKSADEIKKQFNIDDYLPEDTDDDRFDLSPIKAARKVSGNGFLNPMLRVGEMTTLGSLRHSSKDIRGDIPNPQIPVSVWNQPTSYPDHNIKGICAGTN